MKFSIIVPIFNLEKYLNKCLHSLATQTYTNIEIICVNDGSTDNSLGILKKYAEQDNRIKIIDKNNEGVSISRNEGIKIATGDYILFVDGDDWLDERACEILNNNISNNNYDLIYFNYNIYTKKFIRKIKMVNNISKDNYLNYFKKDGPMF